MSVEAVSEIANKALFIIIEASLPCLLISLIVGLIISFFQTVTSIQEQTLTFVPKIISIFIVLMLFGKWILNLIIDFMTELWLNFSAYVK